ncbi:MAG: hypothetical protein KC615_24815, partial [Anaerolineae bacterium]|nr:hypothetical protein [Anaerolineae bacterium]
MSTPANKSVRELFETMEYGPAPESDENANAWLDSHERHFGAFIGNVWKAPAGLETITVVNPARGAALAQVVD